MNDCRAIVLTHLFVINHSSYDYNILKARSQDWAWCIKSCKISIAEKCIPSALVHCVIVDFSSQNTEISLKIKLNSNARV